MKANIFNISVYLILLLNTSFCFPDQDFGDCREGVNTKILYPGADPSESTLIPNNMLYLG